MLHAHLAEIPFAPMAVIALGFDRAAVTHDLDGFGLLMPGREKRELLGVLWTSSIFPRRAPEGQGAAALHGRRRRQPRRAGAGRRGAAEPDPGRAAPLLGIKGTPAMVRIIRHRRAIAQYVPGHLARLAALDRELAAHPGLFLTGSSYKGISVNSCVKEAEAVADLVVAHLAATAGNANREAV